MWAMGLPSSLSSMSIAKFFFSVQMPSWIFVIEHDVGAMAAVNDNFRLIQLDAIAAETVCLLLFDKLVNFDEDRKCKEIIIILFGEFICGSSYLRRAELFSMAGEVDVCQFILQ